MKDLMAKAGKAAKQAGKAASDAAAKTKAAITGEVPPPPEPVAEEGEESWASMLGGAGQSAEEELTSCLPAKLLTRRQRLYGYVICMVLGGLLAMLSTIFFWGGKAHLASFAITYTLGNLCSICSTGFFVGPCTLCKMMFKPVRRVAAIIYLSCLVGTIVVAIWYPFPPLLLLIISIQYSAMFWYGLSYVPFGRTIFCKCFKRVQKRTYKAVMEEEG
jgi:hypothetical protein